jgi:hypothetical protein
MPQSEFKFVGLAGAASGEISTIVEAALLPWPFVAPI